MNYIALRRLLSGFVLYSLGDFLLFGLSYLVILPILTRSLEPDEYGVVATLTNLTLFVAWTIQFGLPSAALRYYFNFSEAETRHSYLVGIWLLCLLLGIVVGLLVLAFGQPIWNYTIRNVPFFPYAPLIVLIAFFSVTNTFRYVLLRASDKPRLFIFVDTAQFICQAVFIYYAVTIVRLGVIGQVLGILGATGIFAGISAIIILYRVNFRQISFRLGNIFSFAWPLYLTYVIGFFQSRASVLILQFFITGGAIGIFAVGQQFGNLLLIGTSAFTKAWQPYLYSQSTEQARKTLYRIGFSVPLIMICVVGLGPRPFK